MSNPLDIERMFQELKRILSLPSSPRNRLLAIGRFLNALHDRSLSQEPYLIELAEYLPGILKQAEFEGCDPQDVRTLYEQMRVFESYAVDTSMIRGAAASLFVYAGEIAKASSLFENSAIPDSFPENSPNVTPYARLQKAIDECNDERVAAELKTVAERLLQNMTSQDYAIIVPVVEHPFVKAAAAEYEGSLRRIRIEVLGESRNGKDEIHADVSVFGAETNAAEIIAAPTTAARNLIKEKHPDIVKRFVTGHLLFEDNHFLHEGSSANLGIALLVYCAILRSTMQREHYRILPTVAATGDIDEEGNVRPVEATTLRNKVKAAFYSWVEFLIVPKQQLAVAEESLGSLAGKYPNRRLTLIGVANMREVFFDRRLAERIRVPFPKHAASKVWKWRMPIAGAIILLLAVALGLKLYGPLDKNPVGYKFEGEMLYIVNKSDKVIDEIEVGSRTVSFHDDVKPYPVVRKPVAFLDVDGDGTKEIIWLQYADEGVGNHMIVNCRTVTKKILTWSFPLRRTLHFPNSTDITTNDLVSLSLLADDFERDGVPDVIVNSWLRPFFPAVVFKINATTGKEVAHYVATGPFVDLDAVDTDFDGIKEVLLFGWNNAFGDPCLTVLDPRIIRGHSPVTEQYVIDGYSVGVERAYLRIPKTQVGKTFYWNEGLDEGEAGASLLVEPSERMVRLIFVDACVRVEGRQEKVKAYLLGFFNYDLSVSDFGSSSDFDRLYELLVKKGTLPNIRRDRFLREYKKSMMYWDGEGWQTKPVFNKWYLKALKEAGLPPPRGFALEAPK